MNPAARLWRLTIDTARQPGLHRDALFLAAATIVSGLGSLIYWKLVTLRFSAEMVGLTSIGITSAAFLGGLANMGLGAALVRFLPAQAAEQKAGLVRATTRVSLATGLGAGLIFLLGRAWWAPKLIPPQAGLPYALIFMALLLAIAQMNINTAVIEAARRTPYMLLQSMLINVIQIAGAGLVMLNLGATGILFTYALPILIVATGFYYVLPAIGRFAGAVQRPKLNDLLRYGLNTQVFSVVWQLPAFIFPLVTLARFGPEASAGLALTWYAYTFLGIIPNALMVALLIDGSHDPDRFSRRLWDALLLNLAILTPIVLGILVFAPALLGFFGKDYIRAAHLLRLLALSVLPLSINGVYITRWRVSKQMLSLNIFTIILTVGSLLLALLLMTPFGLDGIGWGWLTGQSCAALLTLTLLLRERRRAQTRLP